jgi:hypothetical protein
MGFSHTRPPTLEEAEAGDFTTVTTKEDKRKQRKMEKQKPQFQFDTSYFRLGKKIGIAVGQQGEAGERGSCLTLS